MTPQRTVHRLDSARAAIHQALTQWDAVNPSQIHRCSALVEKAVSDLREFTASLETADYDAPKSATTALADIQREAARMNRLVDAGLAFQRGLLMRLGEAAPAYGASGMAIEPPCRTDFCGLEA
jgi:hypothetical protein